MASSNAAAAASRDEPARGESQRPRTGAACSRDVERSAAAVHHAAVEPAPRALPRAPRSSVSVRAPRQPRAVLRQGKAPSRLTATRMVRVRGPAGSWGGGGGWLAGGERSCAGGDAAGACSSRGGGGFGGGVASEAHVGSMAEWVGGEVRRSGRETTCGCCPRLLAATNHVAGRRGMRSLQPGMAGGIPRGCGCGCGCLRSVAGRPTVRSLVRWQTMLWEGGENDGAVALMVVVDAAFYACEDEWKA